MLMRLSSGKVSQLLASIPQQRPRETHCSVRDCLLLGQLVRNVGESNSRACTVTQSKLHLPKPTQLALPSGSLLFLNRPLSIFFLQNLLEGLEFVLMQNRKISEI